ncbi:conserved hypothetical protein [Ricinus communis]|uniref:Uncharacterized protein n=1 Tax=Ricinus communis TaxID=3988 RepID=B9T0G1_RICCO|nr:conserved hypothetical protein [Ricinus communis]
MTISQLWQQQHNNEVEMNRRNEEYLELQERIRELKQELRGSCLRHYYIWSEGPFLGESWGSLLDGVSSSGPLYFIEIAHIIEDKW